MGDTRTVAHEKKVSITRPGRDLKRAAAVKAKKAGLDPARKIESPHPMATALKERVGEYEADVFTLPVEASKDTRWVVRNFPKFSAFTPTCSG